LVPQWLPEDKWTSLIKDAHIGYISWNEYEKNQKKLKDNSLGKRGKREYPPREGPALLQGLAICGRCGRKMSIRYRKPVDTLLPIYQCAGILDKFCGPKCQSIPGVKIDEAIGNLLVEKMSLDTIEVCLAVQKELQNRIEEADAIRRKQLERIKYEVDLARKRYMNVDPENRLVAESLESEWNEKLREYSHAKDVYERKRKVDQNMLNDETRKTVQDLITDFPKIWKDPRTLSRDRKRMVRLLIEDVTLIKDESLLLHIRFKGGAIKTITLPKPKTSWENWTTDPAVVTEIDRLLDDYTNSEIANILNNKQFVSGQGKSFDGRRIGKIQKAYGLKSRYNRLIDASWLTVDGLAKILGLSPSGVRARRRKGLLKSIKVNDTGQHLYAKVSITKM